MAGLSEEPEGARVSRTARYRKVTKPLLERRRRARINRCLDELKDLMVGALEVERENINKLEKADILELTVRHLSKLRGPRDPREDAERFQAGFGHCATEAYHFILSTPGVDSQITRQLVRHLSTQMGERQLVVPNQRPPISPVPSVSPISSSRSAYSPNYAELRSSPSLSPAPTEDTGIGSEDPRYNREWSEEPPSVPVENSLTCDVGSYPLPQNRRTTEPLTGLLMTVNNGNFKPPQNIPEETLSRRRQSTNDSRDNRDISDNRHGLMSDNNLERKNVILKKIREHIMERQLREPEPIVAAKPNPSSFLQKHFIPKQILPASSTTDNVYVDKSTSSCRNNNYDGFNTNERISEYDAEHHRRSRYEKGSHDEAINLSSSDSSIKNMPPSEDNVEKPANSSLRKRHADYKSIHPKKVMIRAPSNEYLVNCNETSNKTYHNTEDNSSCCSSKSVEVPQKKSSKLHVLEDNRSGFQRYKNHVFNLEREEYFQENPNDQDDMWRPW